MQYPRSSSELHKSFATLPFFRNTLDFGRNQRLTEPEPGGCGLLRAATISSVPSIGAKSSVGYGGSPLVQTLRLA
jgi:hypothetical protein